MKWEDLSQTTRDVMREFGDFGPTVNAASRELKGATYDDDCGGSVKTYWTSDYLRQIAAACIEAADWLDKRADAAKLPSF